MTKRVFVLVLLAVALSPRLAAQAQKRLWVLQPPDKLVEYNTATFAPGPPVTVPVEVLTSPESLAVNKSGQILFAPQPYNAALDANSHTKLWFWDGHRVAPLDRGTVQTERAGRSSSVVEAIAQPYLALDGRHLYWFANIFAKQKSSEGLELSVEASFRVWQTDLDGKHVEQVVSFSFLPCKCDTGVCEETCPQAEFWAPETGVGDFFVVTHWVPGQSESQYHSSFLYRMLNGKWSAKKLSHPLHAILDAAGTGSMLVEANPDNACCGSANESDDQTLLTSDGRVTVLFDERERYRNENYDVSFSTRTARLAPRSDFVALEIVSSAESGAEIRLSNDGQANARELAEIKKAMSYLPAVEVLALAPSHKRIALLPHAALVGWLNETEVLIIEGQQLVALNPTSGSRRKSGIKADPSRVFLR